MPNEAGTCSSLLLVVVALAGALLISNFLRGIQIVNCMTMGRAAWCDWEGSLRCDQPGQMGRWQEDRMPCLKEGKVEKGRLESLKGGGFQKSVRLFAKASFTYLLIIASIVTAAASNECPSPDPEHSVLACTAIIDNPLVRGEAAAMAYIARSDAYVSIHKLDLALDDLNHAIAAEPTLARAFDKRAEVHRMRSELEAALQDQTLAIELKPTTAEYYYDRGNLYLQAHDFNASINDYNTALRIKPSFALALLNRGIVYGQSGRFNEAIADLSEEIRLNPNDANGYLNRGIVFAQTEKLDSALADFANAIQHDPRSADAYSFRGNIYRKLGRRDEAVVDFRKALQINPNDAQSKRMLDMLESAP